MRFQRHDPKSGAALILAVIILVMMMAMGLPFLFTQSAALTGASSFRSRTVAATGQDSALTLARGLAGEGIAEQFNQGYTLVNEGINKHLELPQGDAAAYKLSKKYTRNYWG